MATLADSFLQDLADLEEDDEYKDMMTNGALFAVSGKYISGAVNDEEESDDEPIQDAVMLYKQSQTGNISVVSNLSMDQDFMDILAKVKETATHPPLFIENDTGSSTRVLDPSETRLIEQSNQLIAKLDIEILNIHSFVRDIYSKKFPELESIVTSPLEYIAVVQRIKNEVDLTSIELGNILPNTVTMAVTVAGSMTTGYPLPPADLDKVLKACEEAIHLADCRKVLLGYLESRMDVIAPNVSAIIGSALAARVVTHANGITQLARMPSQNIMLIGSSSASSMKTYSSGQGVILGGSTTSSSGSGSTRSIIYGCDIVQMTPLAARNRALKLVAGKLGLAARVDSFRESPHGEVGRALREHILRSLMRAQEPPPAPLKKALPVPDDAPKSRRGGKRYRRSKEKYRMSEFQKESNRLTFGPEAEEELDLEGEIGLGMVGKAHGKLRLQTKQTKIQVKRQKRQQRHITEGHACGISSHSTPASSGATGGMSSSLAFTPLQGIELCNPGAQSQHLPTIKDQNNEYFSSAVTFLKVEDQPTQ